MATGLLNLLGTLSDATTTPTVNPLYGAQYLTPDDHPAIPKAGWYGADGTDVSDKMAAIPTEQHGTITSQPYVQPGFWGKLGSTGRSISMANAQAESMGGNAINSALSQRKGAEALDPTLSNNLYAQTYDSRFGPANRGLVAKANAYNNTNAPSIAGGNEGTSDIYNTGANALAAAGNYNRQPTINSTLDANAVNNQFLAQNVTPLEYSRAKIQAASELQREPSEQEILNTVQKTRQIGTNAENTAAPNNAKTLIGQSLLGVQRTQAEQDLLPYQIATERANATSGLYQAEHPPITQPSVFDAYVNPDNMSILTGRLPMKQQMLGQMAAGSNGASLSPNGAPSYSDPNGNSLNVPSEEDLGGGVNGAIDPLHQHIIDTNDAQHDAEQADIKAKKAALDAESKQRKAQHLVGKTALFEQQHPHGLGSIVGSTLGNTLKDLTLTYNPVYKGLKLLGHSISGE